MHYPNINRVVLVGRLRGRPKLRTQPGGELVYRLRLAVRGMGSGGRVGHVNVNVRDKRGKKTCEGLTANSLVVVDGRIVQGKRGATEPSSYNIEGRVEPLATENSVTGKRSRDLRAPKRRGIRAKGVARATKRARGRRGRERSRRARGN